MIDVNIFIAFTISLRRVDSSGNLGLRFEAVLFFGSSGMTVKDYSPQRRGVHRCYFLLPLLRDLSASAVQFPSPRTEIALARLVAQKPEYPVF